MAGDTGITLELNLALASRASSKRVRTPYLKRWTIVGFGKRLGIKGFYRGIGRGEKLMRIAAAEEHFDGGIGDFIGGLPVRGG